MSKETSPVEASGNKLELPLDIRATAFQRRAWEALIEIPAGTTVTYSEKAPAEAATNTDVTLRFPSTLSVSLGNGRKRAGKLAPLINDQGVYPAQAEGCAGYRRVLSKGAAK